MIPGEDILDIALSVIANQTIAYYRYVSRALNDVGQEITLYEVGVNIVGSFQPVPRQLYMSYGLDLQKDYYTFYTSNNILDVNRNVSGDQIAFDGKRFQCESANDWFAMDGWKGVLCVRISGVGENVPVFGFNQNPPINDNENYDQGVFGDE